MKSFKFLREEEYECAGIRNVMKEYVHEQTGMEFVLIPGGTFMMGSDRDSSKRAFPVHEVTLSSYLIGKYLCTQSQWAKMMGNNPSYYKGENRPVEKISWNDCQDCCKKTGLSLPTEAQWEYACRGGNSGAYCFGEGDWEELGEFAWHFFHANSGNITHDVGEKKNNAYGLYDMHGHVLEWCQDKYASYKSAKKCTDPLCLEGSGRVTRGGGSVISGVNARYGSYVRWCNGQSTRCRDTGVRLASPA